MHLQQFVNDQQADDRLAAAGILDVIGQPSGDFREYDKVGQSAR